MVEGREAWARVASADKKFWRMRGPPSQGWERHEEMKGRLQGLYPRLRKSMSVGGGEKTRSLL